jgi:hypothetical protein
MIASVFIVIASTIFTQSLHADIPVYAPSISPDAAIAAGAGGAAVRELARGHAAELAGLLLSFANAFDRIMYLCAGVAAVGFVITFGTGWKDVRKKSVKKGVEEKTATGTDAV